MKCRVLTASLYCHGRRRLAGAVIDMPPAVARADARAGLVEILPEADAATPLERGDDGPPSPEADQGETGTDPSSPAGLAPQGSVPGETGTDPSSLAGLAPQGSVPVSPKKGKK